MADFFRDEMHPDVFKRLGKQWVTITKHLVRDDTSIIGTSFSQSLPACSVPGIRISRNRERCDVANPLYGVCSFSSL